MAGLLSAFLGLLAGAFVAVQATINAELSRGLGMPVAAAVVSFIAGAVVLTALTGLLSHTQDVAIDWRAPPLWQFVAGGCLGAAYVTITIILVPRVGAAATMAFVVSGQLFAGIMADRLGLFGMAVREITFGRIAGAALLLAGTVLVTAS